VPRGRPAGFTRHNECLPIENSPRLPPSNPHTAARAAHQCFQSSRPAVQFQPDGNGKTERYPAAVSWRKSTSVSGQCWQSSAVSALRPENRFRTARRGRLVVGPRCGFQPVQCQMGRFSRPYQPLIGLRGLDRIG
jgi:hypothetical protein